MKNLIWQFHIDLNRPDYDGGLRREMTYFSMSTVSLYSAMVGADYELCTNSKWHLAGVRGGPAMERFQLMGEKYDKYDYILYLDTDILMHPRSVDLFSSVPSETHIAADNWIHKYDTELLESGWLSKQGSTFVSRYRESAIQGGIILMSREFRRWFRNSCDPTEISCDEGLKWPDNRDRIKWPVYDQSLMSYYITISPFTLFNINRKDILNRNHIVHMHGKKSNPDIQYQYIERSAEMMSAWATCLSRKIQHS